MSENQKRMPFREAERHARRLVLELTTACERIEIAGSVRRRMAAVGDLEIVAIPRMASNLLGDLTESLLDARLRRLEKEGLLRRIKGGKYYQQFEAPFAQCKLDLFTPCHETWGMVYMIRTGSARFAHRMVTPRDRRTSDGDPGLMSVGLAVRNARIWRGSECIPAPEETDVFRVMGVEWVRPEDRC